MLTRVGGDDDDLGYLHLGQLSLGTNKDACNVAGIQRHIELLDISLGLRFIALDPSDERSVKSFMRRRAPMLFL